MLIANAESAAVEAKMVIATCSLISDHTELSASQNRSGDQLLTERPRIKETPETRVGGLKTRMLVSRTWQNLLQKAAQEVTDDLDEELADEHRLRSEVLLDSK